MIKSGEEKAESMSQEWLLAASQRRVDSGDSPNVTVPEYLYLVLVNDRGTWYPSKMHLISGAWCFYQIYLYLCLVASLKR